MRVLVFMSQMRIHLIRINVILNAASLNTHECHSERSFLERMNVIPSEPFDKLRTGTASEGSPPQLR